MNKLTTLAIIGIVSLGTVCMAMAADAANKANAPAANPQDGEAIVVIESVAYTDGCANDPASPCVKDGKCVCADKSQCKNCMKHMKKCDSATQAKCLEKLKNGTMPCPSGKTCPKDPSNSPK